MNELLHDDSADDAVIARLRAALDEVTDGVSEGAVPAAHRTGLSAGRWFAIAAAAILVVGAATAVAVNRRNAPETASTPTDAATTLPASTTTATDPTPIRTVTPWYTLASQDLVPGEIETLPNQLTGETSSAWALGGDPASGLFMLRSGPASPDMAPADTSLADYQMIGDQAVAVSSYGIDAQQQADLLAQVQPGPGSPWLPWRLPVDGWVLLGMGTGDDDPTLAQAYSSDSGEVTITVGPLANQFLTLATTGGIEPVTVAGETGWKATNADGAYVLWPAGDYIQWASLAIPAAFADRVDGLIAAVVEVDPTQPTVETVPAPETVGSGVQDIVSIGGVSLPLYEPDAADPAVGATPPTLDLVGGDGQPSSLLAGETGPALVVFVAEWCPHCESVVPLLQSAMAHGTIPGDEEVVLVVTASERDQALSWLAGQQWAGRVLIDTQEGERAAGQAANAFGATGWPFWVAVGADGTVTNRAAGTLDDTALQALVAASTTPTT